MQASATPKTQTGRSGFSIIKNGDRLGYPYLESLRSLAPLVDEIVVAHGNSDDTTLASLHKLNNELGGILIIVDSPWDPTNTKGGNELARQSNIALSHCHNDICFYLQSDEVLHDKEIPIIQEDLSRFANETDVDALVFRWIHFYGNYETVVHSKKWYRREIRAIKKSRGLKSVGDAQGFRIQKPDGSLEKPRAALSRAHVLHYGWAKPPKQMSTKTTELNRLWNHPEQTPAPSVEGPQPEITKTHNNEDLFSLQYGLHPFQGTHPVYLQDRIAREGYWNPFKDLQLKKDLRYWRMWSTGICEKLFDWRPGEFTNYCSLKKY